MNLLFEKFSHIKYSSKTVNDVLHRVKKGETYIVDDEYNAEGVVKEDIVKTSFFKQNTICIAKEDRWYSGDNQWFATIEELLSDWNNSVTYDKDEDVFYNRPWLEIYLLNGEKFKKFFDTDQQLVDALDELTKDGINIIPINF